VEDDEGGCQGGKSRAGGQRRDTVVAEPQDAKRCEAGKGAEGGDGVAVEAQGAQGGEEESGGGRFVVEILVVVVGVVIVVVVAAPSGPSEALDTPRPRRLDEVEPCGQVQSRAQRLELRQGPEAVPVQVDGRQAREAAGGQRAHARHRVVPE